MLAPGVPIPISQGRFCIDAIYRGLTHASFQPSLDRLIASVASEQEMT